MRIQNFKPKWLEDHVKRIFKGAEFFKVNMDEKKVFSVVDNALENNELKEARMRIILHESGVLDTTLGFFKDTEIPLKFKLKIVDEPQGEQKLWPFRKHVENEGEEVILIENKTGFVLEGSYTNVFVKTDVCYLTPPADGKIIEGIGRKHFIEEIRKNGETVKEEWFSSEIFKNNEVILTNALRGIIRTGPLS